jgi:hypothetical protein
MLAALALSGASIAQQKAMPSASQERARAVLMHMAHFVAGLPGFNVKISATYDTVQRSGEKIEFGETRTISLRRPDRLRVATVRTDGTLVLTVFSGTEIMLADLASNVYATTRQTGGLDAALMHYIGDLGMRMPLAVLLSSNLPSELGLRVSSVEYVELTSLYGGAAHHLAARTPSVDFQVWIADGEKPLPQRIVITYKHAEGQPQYRALFAEWNLAPEVTETTFSPVPPEGAQKIAFAAQLPRAVPMRIKPRARVQ